MQNVRGSNPTHIVLDVVVEGADDYYNAAKPSSKTPHFGAFFAIFLNLFVQLDHFVRHAELLGLFQKKLHKMHL